MASNSLIGAAKYIETKPKPTLRILIPEPCTAEKIIRLSKGLALDWEVIPSSDNSGLTCVYHNIVTGEVSIHRPEKDVYKSCALMGGKRTRRKRRHTRRNKRR